MSNMIMIGQVYWQGDKLVRKYASLCFTLPAFINEIYHQCTEDKENEQGDKHVVDSPDVVHLK